MNYQRILQVANAFFLSTGYQIRTLDTKTHRYRLSLWSALYFLLLLLIYIICFEHHLEESAILKIMLDLSPFLKNLIIIQIWLGLKALVFCIIEWRSLTKVLNGLVELLLVKNDDRSYAADRWGELLAYIMFFGTLVVAFCFGLYIAIEMKFELPPLDHIMIALALFIPHYTTACSLRLHNLTLWLLRKELGNYRDKLLSSPTSDHLPEQDVVIEIINPVFKPKPKEGTEEDTAVEECAPLDTYRQVLQGVQSIASYLSSSNNVLQRQIFVLNSLNYNCLLYGIYSKFYYEKTWHVIFTGRNRRIFHAANLVIFVCIILDYLMFIVTLKCFQKMKRDFSNELNVQIEGLKNTSEDKRTILYDINRILREKLNLKLYSLVDFKLYNFSIIQAFMVLSIAVTILYQYFNDQIAALTQLMESINDEDDD